MPFAPLTVAIVCFAMVEVSAGADLVSCLGTIDLNAVNARIASTKTAAALMNEIVVLNMELFDDLLSFSDIKRAFNGRSAILIPLPPASRYFELNFKKLR